MKFTKTALAVAIAGIAAAPMVATADTTLSGIIEINVNGSDIDVDDDTTTPEDESLAGDPRVGTGDVFFGVVAEQELDSGLTGYGSLRLDLDGLSSESDLTYDNVYTGIKGGFGDFRIGEIPLAVEYGQVANDIFDVGGEVDGGLSYTGTFGPVGVIANYSFEPNSEGEVLGLGAKFGIGGFAVGVGFEDRDESQNLSAGASFAFAGAAISAHYWTKEIGAGAEGVDVNLDDENGIALQVGYGFGGIAAKLTYATAAGDLPDGFVFAGGGTEAEAQAIRLDLGYDLGGGLNVSTRITAYTIEDNTYEIEDSTEDQTQWRVQLAKSF